MAARSPVASARRPSYHPGAAERVLAPRSLARRLRSPWLVAALLAALLAPPEIAAQEGAKRERGIPVEVVEPEKPKAADGGEEPDWRAPLNLGEMVTDDAPIQSIHENRDEVVAYNALILHARKIPEAVLAQNARQDVSFRHLFGDDRASYRGQLVRVEGRLKLLVRHKPTEALLAEKPPVRDLYEAWIFPDVSYGVNPLCVIVSELPEGLQPSEKVNLRAAANAYSFKRYKYKAGDGFRLAPLLIGRTLEVLPAQSSETGFSYAGAFVPAVVILGGLVLGLTLGLTWWFRRGDRAVQSRVEAAARPAFVDPTEPPNPNPNQPEGPPPPGWRLHQSDN